MNEYVEFNKFFLENKSSKTSFINMSKLIQMMFLQSLKWKMDKALSSLIVLNFEVFHSLAFQKYIS